MKTGNADFLTFCFYISPAGRREFAFASFPKLLSEMEQEGEENNQNISDVILTHLLQPL